METDIQFLAAFGSEGKVVRLTHPSGGSSSFHIMIDKFYCGSINKMMDGWKVFFNSPDFTQADADALIDIINEKASHI